MTTAAIPATDQLSALDATFLELEQADDSALMHIGGAFVFEALPGGGTPTIEAVRQQLDRRLDLLPRYRQKLTAPRTGGLAWPSWEHDERFDLEAQVRHATLPPPGGHPELLDWISDFYSHRLDRSRPLWQMMLLDGLADGRWALVWKTHHCLVDGVGSVDVTHLLLDAEAEPRPPSVSRGAPASAPDESPHAWFTRTPESLRQVVGSGLAATRVGAHALVHPREALERSRAVIELLVHDELVAAPHTSLNVSIGATRRVATVHVELAQLRAITSALGGTINDVVLCVATAAMRELLLVRGEEPPRQGLRAMVPVSIRRKADHAELGNMVSSLFVDLPVDEADALRRYRLVRAAVVKQKTGGQALAASTVTGLAELAPPVLHAVIARSLFASRLFNVTITNVPGPPQRLYSSGAPMVDILPFVPLAAGHALGIAVVSYAGGLTFGLCADRVAVPDLDVLRDGVAAAVRELSALAGTSAG